MVHAHARVLSRRVRASVGMMFARAHVLTHVRVLLCNFWSADFAPSEGASSAHELTGWARSYSLR